MHLRNREFKCNFSGCTKNARWISARPGYFIRMHSDGKPLHSWELEELPLRKKWYEVWK